jgi:hypothetical protein
MITAPGGGFNVSLCSSRGEIELGRGTSMGKQQRFERKGGKQLGCEALKAAV